MIANRLSLSKFPITINFAFVFTLALIIVSIIVPFIFQKEFVSFGQPLLLEHGQDKLDLSLYIVTAISSTPVALPVWSYAVFGTMIGYDPTRLIIIIALGASTGSTVSYFIGRYFGTTDFVKRNFPNIENHPWTEGRSRWIVSIVLFVGAASPIPFDIMYAACGLKRFPALLFWMIIVLAWSLKVSYLVYGYRLIQ